MNLVWNWKAVLKKGWSVRFILLTGALSGCEMALPLFSDAIPRNVFLVVAMFTTGAALWARIVAQPKLNA